MEMKQHKDNLNLSQNDSPGLCLNLHNSWSRLAPFIETTIALGDSSGDY